MQANGHREPYSGEHETTGMNVQVAASLDGEPRWTSDPTDGSRHDTHRPREPGALSLDLHHNVSSFA